MTMSPSSTDVTTWSTVGLGYTSRVLTIDVN